MMSFDVLSLFTRVPTDETLQVVSTLLQGDGTPPDRTAITPDDICNLVRICLHSTYFQVKGRFFDQVEGAEMGSPLSPIVANLYMEAFYSLWL